MAPFVVPVRRAIVSCPQPRRALSTQGAAATWMLNLNTNGEVRAYTVMGKTNLIDAPVRQGEINMQLTRHKGKC